MTLASVRFLHTADWQLGMRRHFLGEEALPRFVQARIDAIRTIGRVAREQKCAFVVVAGDVFEDNQLDRRTIVRSVEALREIELPVYLLPGNHDPLDAATLFRRELFADAPNVKLLLSGDPVEAAPGVDLIGAPWPSKRPRRDLVADALADIEPAPDRLRILVGHGIVDTLSPDREDPERIVLATVRAAIEKGRVQFVALGDRHSPTEVAPRIWFSGAPEPTDFGEIDSGAALVVDLSRSDCRVEPHRIGTWSYHSLERVLNGIDDVEDLARELAALPGKETAIVRVALQGALSLAPMARLDDVLEQESDRFAALFRWERNTELVLLPALIELDDLGLSGFARTAAEQLAAREGDPDAAAALALLYRLASGEAKA